MQGFLANTLQRLGNKHIALLRGDSGFSDNASLSNLEKKTALPLRYKPFAKPAYTTTEGRKPILNLALTMQQRQWMKGRWDEATQFDLKVKFSTHHPPGAG